MTLNLLTDLIQHIDLIRLGITSHCKEHTPKLSQFNTQRNIPLTESSHDLVHPMNSLPAWRTLKNSNNL